MEDGRWTSAVEVIVKRGLLSDVTTTNVSADSNSFKRLIRESAYPATKVKPGKLHWKARRLAICRKHAILASTSHAANLITVDRAQKAIYLS